MMGTARLLPMGPKRNKYKYQHKDLTEMFRTVLFIITKNWKQSIHQLVNRLVYPYDAVISQQCRGMNY